MIDRLPSILINMGKKHVRPLSAIRLHLFPEIQDIHICKYKDRFKKDKTDNAECKHL